MAHRYWRLYWPSETRGIDTVLPGTHGLCGLRISSTAGGANLFSTATVTASSEYTGLLPAANAAVAWADTTLNGWGINPNSQTAKLSPVWLKFVFSSAIELEEFQYQRPRYLNKIRSRVLLQYSDDDVTWTTKWYFIGPDVSGNTATDFLVFNEDSPMRIAAPDPFAYSYEVLSLVNFPTQEVQATSTLVQTAFNKTAQEVRVTSLEVLSLVKGRVYDPKMRAWAFTLDSHEYYVLRLGSDRTLIYDLTTGQWSWWSSKDMDLWRLSIGTNWYTAGPVSREYGSNVVCGDDVLGRLWVLNPDQGYDDLPSDVSEPQYFPRSATGQVTTRDRTFIPINQVYLTADRNYGDDLEVRLLHSTDAGKTYVNCGSIMTEAGNDNQDFAWRSLGLIRPPGSLFRIEDDGAFARIDSLDVL